MRRVMRTSSFDPRVLSLRRRCVFDGRVFELPGSQGAEGEPSHAHRLVLESSGACV